ncbi:hypothetical protein ACWDZX_04850, partial [Streptomyces collinus]
GNHGCVETYVGAPGIMQNIRELDPGSALLHPPPRPVASGLRGSVPELTRTRRISTVCQR